MQSCVLSPLNVRSAGELGTLRAVHGWGVGSSRVMGWTGASYRRRGGDGIPRQRLRCGRYCGPRSFSGGHRATATTWRRLGNVRPQRPRPAPGQPVLLRRHAHARPEVRQAGGAQPWFERQLTPTRVKDRPPTGSVHWWPSLHRGPADLWQRQIQEVEAGWEVMDDYAALGADAPDDLAPAAARGDDRVLGEPPARRRGRRRAVHPPRRLRRRRSASTHSAGSTRCCSPRRAPGDAHLPRRRRARPRSTPTRTSGRELLELHTVGAGELRREGRARLRADPHRLLRRHWESWRGPSTTTTTTTAARSRSWGSSDKNKKATARRSPRAYLRYLAHHPDTAEHLARQKLCLKFIATSRRPGPGPPARPGLPAERHRDRPGAARARGLPVLPAGRGDKVRDPGEDVVATYRALGVKIADARPAREATARRSSRWSGRATRSGIAVHLGPAQRPADRQRVLVLAGPAAGLDARSTAAGRRLVPDDGDALPEPEGGCPAGGPLRRARRPPVPAAAAPTATHGPAQGLLPGAVDVKPHDRITEDHELVQWRFPRLLTTLLDSPDHLSR